MSCRSSSALSLSRVRNLFRTREGVRSAVLLSVAGNLLLTLSACESPSSAPPAEITYFSESESEYAIGPVIARLNEYDERGMFAAIGAILGVDTGYVVADGLNHQLVLLDEQLNPLRTMGRQGEGPGEYQFPSRLARDGDHVAVLDVGLGRVSFLTAGGDFTRSRQVTGNLRDLAAHPELGLLVAGDAFSRSLPGTRNRRRADGLRPDTRGLPHSLRVVPPARRPCGSYARWYRACSGRQAIGTCQL